MAANAFAKARAKDAGVPAKKSKGELWQASEETAALIEELVDVEARASGLEARSKALKAQIAEEGFERFLESYLKYSGFPPTPFTLLGKQAKATYVVQERQNPISDEQFTTLCELLGSDKASEEVQMVETFALNMSALPAEKQEAVQAELGKTLGRLVDKGVLTQEESDAFVSFKNVRVARPGVLGRLLGMVGERRELLRRCVEAFGSTVVRYVKT
jgi:hypothetical protein